MYFCEECQKYVEIYESDIEIDFFEDAIDIHLVCGGKLKWLPLL